MTIVRGHRDRYVVHFWIAYYYKYDKKVSCQMIVCHPGQDTFYACDRYFAYASITQSVIFPCVESKLMPTFVMGFPLRANRWR